MTGFYPTSEAWAIEGGISAAWARSAIKHGSRLRSKRWAPNSLTRLALDPQFEAGNAVGLGLGAEHT